jgi:hypothetical protein
MTTVLRITKDILTFDKYEIHVNQLNNSRFNYAVQLRQLTPKAKYMPYKSIFNYGFKTYEEALDYANKHKEEVVNKLEHRKVEKVKEVEENKVDPKDFYKIGDIVVNTWGYEQTNVEFYQVISMTARTIKVKRIYGTKVEGSTYSHGMACEVTPTKNKFYEDKHEKYEYQLRVKKDGNLSKPESFYHFHKWSGSPQYQSWYA